MEYVVFYLMGTKSTQLKIMSIDVDKKGKISATIVISENTKSHKDQQAFFANYQNKTQFISLLAKHLELIGHCVKVSTSDADTVIVSSVLECARKGQTAIVVAEDTDVFQMLLCHWKTV